MLDHAKRIAGLVQNLPSDDTLRRLLEVADKLDQLPTNETLQGLVTLVPLLEHLSRNGSLSQLTEAESVIRLLLDRRNYDRLLRLLELLPRNFASEATVRDLISRLDSLLEKADAFKEFLGALKEGG